MERTTRVVSGMSLAAAAAIAVASVGGIALPGTYARETVSWTAQGVGQDWVNLLLVVPWMIVTALLEARGSRVAALLLGGALVYGAYSYAIYAFAVHFNGLFLVYCAALGLSVFALAGLLAGLLREGVTDRLVRAAPVRGTAALLMVVAVLFGGLWLLQIVPALAQGRDPEGLADVGLVTNPVHVLDLSLVLPAMAATAVALWRRRAMAFVLAPVLLGFGVLMAAAIAGMIVMMRARGVASDATGSVIMVVVATACAITLVRVLRRQARAV